MNILVFEKDNCQGCYKCIRHCEVKAISYKDGYASINVKDCVLCGECVNVCPTHAKSVKDDLNLVKEMLKNKEQVIVSLAPSYKAYFNNVSLGKMVHVLRRFGFNDIQETALAAEVVNNAYIPFVNSEEKKHYITSACYSTILLIEKYYPDLVEYLLPVDSPMMTHAKLLKKENPNARVVFIGPCVSKKAEAENIINKGTVDAVLTFEDIEHWMNECGYEFDEEDTDLKGVINPLTRIYPKNEGVIQSIDTSRMSNKYTRIHVNGLEQVRRLFYQLVEDKEKNTLPPLFIEAHVCLDSCIGGPILRKKYRLPSLTSTYLNSDRQSYDDTVPSCINQEVNIHHPFFARDKNDLIPTEEDIQFILAQTGKYTKEDEINCGACGYATCREKAIAVFQKKADIDMCLPFFRKRAESLSNVIIDHSPNAIFVLNEALEVQEFNKRAEEMFNLNKTDTINHVIPMFMSEDIFDKANKTNMTIRKKNYYSDVDKMCQLMVTYVVQHHLYLVIIEDITEIENQRNALNVMRNQTIDATSEVIEKQMRVAQEIASLLGETTAQTKVTLTKLKQIVMQEDENS